MMGGAQRSLSLEAGLSLITLSQSTLASLPLLPISNRSALQGTRMMNRPEEAGGACGREAAKGVSEGSPDGARQREARGARRGVVGAEGWKYRARSWDEQERRRGCTPPPHLRGQSRGSGKREEGESF